MGGVLCAVCGKRLRSRYNLRLHMAVHTGDKAYICQVCNKGYQQKWNLKTHFSRVHIGLKPFHCKDCGRSFGYASHFKAHSKVHFMAQLDVPDEVKEQMKHLHACSQCPKRFKTSRQLNEHALNHSGERPFTCHCCSKRFLTRRQIARHFQRRCCNPGKQGKKQTCRTEPTPCEICGKIVARYSMPKHLNIHTRRRTYNCKTCNKTFLEAGHLSTHERSHSGIKPYVCEVCGKAHSQIGNLLAHRRRHHGLTDKPLNKTTSRAEPDVEKEHFNTAMHTAASNLEKHETFIILNQSNTQDNSTKTSEKQCTGNETIVDFLQLADKWIATRVKESKHSHTIKKGTFNKHCDEYSENSDRDTSTDDVISNSEDVSGAQGLNVYDNADACSDGEHEVLDRIVRELGTQPMVEAGHLSNHERSHSGIKLSEVCGKSHSQMGNLLAYKRRHHGLADKPPKKTKNRAGPDAESEHFKTAVQSVTSNLEEHETFIILNQSNTQDKSTQTSEEHCTGNETIEDFPQLADKWTGVNETKHSQTIETENPIKHCDEYSENTDNDTSSDDVISNSEDISKAQSPNVYDNAEACSDGEQEVLDRIVSEIGSQPMVKAGHLSNHVRSHSGIKPYLCEVCGKSHSQMGDLLAHRRRHHRLTDKTPKKTITRAELHAEKYHFNTAQPATSISEKHETFIILNQSNTQDNSTQTSEKHFTGNETIKDFLQLADKWIATRVNEPKHSGTLKTATLTKNCDGYSENTDNVTKSDDVISNSENVSGAEGLNEYDNTQTCSDGRQEILNRIVSEIGSEPMVKAVVLKAMERKRKDILRAILFTLGDQLPVNSVVIRNYDGSYLWRCWDCQVFFKTRPLLLRHRYIHVPAHLRPHRCETCNRTFTQVGNLKHHLLVHRQEHRFYCEVCGAGFRHKSHFKTHRQRHDQPTLIQRKYQCDTCGKTCSSRSHLSEHIRTHTKERPYLCLTCGQQFGASSTHARHLRKHECAKTLCSKCGKGFTDDSSRRRHEKNHDMNRQYECVCGKSFTQKASLQRHSSTCPKNSRNLVTHQSYVLIVPQRSPITVV